MANKGIKYNLVSKGDAENYLKTSSYFFRLKAYCKNYSKDENGKYKDLEFAYLKELFEIDRELRRLVLNMTIQIEHALKVRLQEKLCENELEDGFNIINVFEEYNRENNINFAPKKNPYNKDLIEKLSDEQYALWNILEVISFGESNILLECYMNLYGSIIDSMDSDKLKSLLFCIKKLRNACAHNNCLIHNFNTEVNTNKSVRTYVTRNIENVSPATVTTQMKKLIVNDFAVLLYSFSVIIEDENVKRGIEKELISFKERMKQNEAFFNSNITISSTFAFLDKLIDIFCGQLV